jgi:hypothetical protein
MKWYKDKYYVNKMQQSVNNWSTPVVDDTSFLVAIPDTKAFKTLLDYLKFTKDMCWEFSDKGIVSVESAKIDDQTTVLNAIELYGDVLVMNDIDLGSEESESIEVNLDIASFHRKLGTASKESVTLCKRKGYSMIQVVTPNGYDTICDVQSGDNVRQQIPIGYTRDICRVISTQFFGSCEPMAKCGSVYVTLRVYKRGISLYTPNFGDTRMIGDCSETIDEVEQGQNEYVIPTSFIKTLLKLKGLANYFTVKFYYERGLPLKIEMPVSTYGSCSIFLNKNDTQPTIDTSTQFQLEQPEYH